MSGRQHHSSDVVHALEDELAKRQLRIDELEREKLHSIREMSSLRLQEERRRTEAKAQADSEKLESVQQAHAQAQQMRVVVDEQLQVETNKRKAAEERCVKSDELAAELHSAVAQRESELLELRRAVARVEDDSRSAALHAANSTKGLQSRIDALTAIADQRSDEVDAERERTQAAISTAEEYRSACQRALADRSELEARVGELEAVIESQRDELTSASLKIERMRERCDEDVKRAADAQKTATASTNDLEQKVAQLTADVRLRDRQGATFQATIIERDAQIQVLEQSLQRSAAEREAVQEELERALEHHHRLKERIATLESEVSQRTVQLASAEKQSSIRADENRNLQSNQRSLEAAASRSKDENATLRSELRRMTFLEEQNVSLSAALQRTGGDAAQVERRLAEARGHNARLEARIEEFEEEKTAQAGRERELEGAKEQLLAKQKLIDRLRCQLSELQSEQELQRESLQGLQEHNAALTRKCDEHSKLQSRLEAESVKRATLLGTVESLENRLQDYETQITGAFQERDALALEAERLKKSADFAANVQRTLEREQESLRSLQGDLKRSLALAEEKDAEVSEARQRIHQLEQVWHAEQSAHEATRFQLQEAKAHRDESATLVQRLRDATDEVEARDQQMRSLAAANTSKDAELKGKNQQLSEIGDALNVKERKLASLNESISALQIDLGRKDVGMVAAEKKVAKLQLALDTEAGRIKQLRHDLEEREAALAAHSQNEAARSVELQEAKMTIDSTRATCEDLTKRLDSEESARLRADELLLEVTAEVSRLRTSAARVAVLEGKVSASQRLASEREEEISKLSEDCEELRCALRNETIRSSNVASLEGHATELKGTMAKDRAAIEALELQLRDSKASVAEKERALRDAHGQIETFKSKIDSLESAGAKLRAYTEELEANATERHRLDGQLKGMSEVATLHEETIADLKHQIHAQRDHISALEEKLHLSQRLEDDVRLAEEQAAERSRLLSAMEAEELRRSAQLAHTQAELAELQRQQDSTIAQCKALERAKEAAEAATKRVELLLHETETLAEEVERSSVLELNKLHAFACDAAENIEVHKKNAAAAQEAHSRAEDKLKTAQRDLRDAQKENGAVVGKNSALMRSLEDSKASLAQVTSRLQEERKAHTIAKQSQDTADAECDAALAAVDRTHREYSASIESLSQQVEATRQDYAEKVATVSSQQSMIDELRESLHAASDEIARLKVALDQCRMERNDLETRLTRLHDDRARREVAAVETRIGGPSPQRSSVLSPARVDDHNNAATHLAALDRRLYSLKH